MKILFHNQGITPTELEKTEMIEKLSGLEKFVQRDEPVVIDVYLIDESAKQSKNGLDQTVHISALLSGRKVIIEETNINHMQAFLKAYHRFKATLEDRHQKGIDDARS